MGFVSFTPFGITVMPIRSHVLAVDCAGHFSMGHGATIARVKGELVLPLDIYTLEDVDLAVTVHEIRSGFGSRVCRITYPSFGQFGPTVPVER